MLWWKRTEKTQSVNPEQEMEITYGLASIDESKSISLLSPRIRIVTDTDDGKEFILFTEDEYSVLIPFDSEFGILLREESTLATILQKGIESHRRMLS